MNQLSKQNIEDFIQLEKYITYKADEIWNFYQQKQFEILNEVDENLYFGGFSFGDLMYNDKYGTYYCSLPSKWLYEDNWQEQILNIFNKKLEKIVMEKLES